jgi:hypothetical protein
MSIAQAKACVDSREFTDWQAAYEMEPWGEKREDFRAAIVMQANAAAHGGKLKLKDAIELLNPWEEFERKHGADPQSIRTKIRMFNAGIAGLARKKG